MMKGHLSPACSRWDCQEMLTSWQEQKPALEQGLARWLPAPALPQAKAAPARCWEGLQEMLWGSSCSLHEGHIPKLGQIWRKRPILFPLSLLSLETGLKNQVKKLTTWRGLVFFFLFFLL